MDPIVIAMGINCIFFFATHYLFGFEGGWVGVKDRKALDEAAERRAEARRECLEYIRNFNLIEFFRSTAPKNELTYSGLGVFCFFATIGTMYSTDAEFSGDATNILMLLYAIMLPTSVVFAMYPMWPRVLRKYEIIPQAAWHFVIFYMLCFFATFFILVSDFGGLQLFIFALSSMSAILLTGWKRGGFLIALGLYAGSRLFDYYKIGAQPAESKPLEPVFLLLYALIMLAVTVLIFFRPKETEYALSEGRVAHLKELLRIAGDPIAKAKQMREEFIKNIQHETNNPLTGITSMAETLDACYDRLKEKDIKDSIKTILASSVRLETFT
ncbi:MAG: hypothetical protein KDD04_09635, partial [Sinomicrobium sp.]|nr:hypothetical protein [Sinomicrobium sp.]